MLVEVEIQCVEGFFFFSSSSSGSYNGSTDIVPSARCLPAWLRLLQSANNVINILDMMLFYNLSSFRLSAARVRTCAEAREPPRTRTVGLVPRSALDMCEAVIRSAYEICVLSDDCRRRYGKTVADMAKALGEIVAPHQSYLNTHHIETIEREKEQEKDREREREMEKH